MQNFVKYSLIVKHPSKYCLQKYTYINTIDTRLLFFLLLYITVVWSTKVEDDFNKIAAVQKRGKKYFLCTQIVQNTQWENVTTLLAIHLENLERKFTATKCILW